MAKRTSLSATAPLYSLLSSSRGVLFASKVLCSTIAKNTFVDHRCTQMGTHCLIRVGQSRGLTLSSQYFTPSGYYRRTRLHRFVNTSRYGSRHRNELLWIFGPYVIKDLSKEDMIRKANDTDYSLSAGV